MKPYLGKPAGGAQQQQYSKKKKQDEEELKEETKREATIPKAYRFWWGRETHLKSPVFGSVPREWASNRCQQTRSSKKKCLARYCRPGSSQLVGISTRAQFTTKGTRKSLLWLTWWLVSSKTFDAKTKGKRKGKRFDGRDALRIHVDKQRHAPAIPL